MPVHIGESTPSFGAVGLGSFGETDLHKFELYSDDFMADSEHNFGMKNP